MNKPKAIAIVGPTASGKTSLSIAVAKRFDGEVISADSRQVYRGFDIGTGKVTPEEMDGVPHHLIDIADPTTIYSAADFLRDATTAIEDVRRRERTPIIAGGTFFYIELLRGTMTPAPVAPNPALRKTLETYSNAALLKQLRITDPRRANTIDPNNRRRIIRSLEIIDALGTVPEPTSVESDYQWLVIGVTREKEELRKRFQARIQDWLQRGFLDEVQSLQTTPEVRARLPEFGFEYTLAQSHLAGELNETAFIERFVEKNWQYAKRQLTWLKRDPNIVWHNPDDTETIYAAVREFLSE